MMRSRYRRRPYGSTKRRLQKQLAIASEPHYYDKEYSSFSIPRTMTTAWDNTTVVSSSVCQPVVGTDVTNRVGRLIKVEKIRVRGRIDWDNTALVTASNHYDVAPEVRILMYVDKQWNGDTAANVVPSNLLALSTNAHTVNDMFQRAAFFSRFKVLYDKTMCINYHSMNNAADTTRCVSPGCVRVKMNLAPKNLFVRFNGNANGDARDVQGGLIIFAMNAMQSQSSSATQISPLQLRFHGSSRVVFKDV